MKIAEVIFQDANRQNISGAKTSHRGIDLAIDYALTDHWSISIDAAYAQHTYESRISLLGSRGDIKGNDIDTAPKVFGSARLTWDFSAISKKESQAELEWVYMDSYYLEPDNEHEYEGHSLLNLRISSELNEHLSGALRITNLTDEDYAERADFGFGSYRYFVGQSRGIYLELRYQLGKQ